MYTIDQHGRAVIDGMGLFELWFQGGDEQGVVITPSEEIDYYNEQCRLHNKKNFIIDLSTEQPIPHHDRAKDWLIPEEYSSLDIRQVCLALCDTTQQRRRVEHELALFEKRNMFPLLRVIIYMVERFREEKILWGVGRGSSVSSYVLFLIGIHRIDSLKYDLAIEDFLRD